MIVVLMGVSGCGKTTVGTRLARELGWEFLEGDDHHPPRNKEKMKRGHALTAVDRLPWLHRLTEVIRARTEQGQHAVLACSALSGASREILGHCPEVRFIHLVGSLELIRARLDEREHPFMDPGLLASQFEALEPPGEGAEVDVRPTPIEITATIMDRLRADGSIPVGA